MKITEILAQRRPLISFEFFPPKTDEGRASLEGAIEALKPLAPSFVSITYGAGGSTRATTIDLVRHIKSDVGLEAAAHLTCVGHSRDELRTILTDLATSGVDNIIALRGDPPKGQTRFVPAADGFRYASELVGFIRQNFAFCIGVAGYPEKHIEASTIEEDLGHLKEKTDQGGDFIITQLFFDVDAYHRFVAALRRIGVNRPVIAGIMPITDTDQVKRFTQLCGATLPADLLRRLDAAGANKTRVVDIGIEHATRQCEALLRGGAPGVHFYTLNRSHATREVYSRLSSSGVLA